jgi:hypothetical protein
MQSDSNSGRRHFVSSTNFKSNFRREQAYGTLNSSCASKPLSIEECTFKSEEIAYAGFRIKVTQS